MVFSHIALNCADPIATERYYTRHFGFRRARVIPLGNDDQIVFLKLDGTYLELFKASGDAPGAKSDEDGPGAEPEGDGPATRGVRHLAFQVPSVDDHLGAMGDDAVVSLGPLAFDDFIPGWRTVWLSDPDGAIVEVSQGYMDQDDPPPMVTP